MRGVIKSAWRTFRKVADAAQQEPMTQSWDPISPRIPPLNAFTIVGEAQNYFIHEGYVARMEIEKKDFTKKTEEYQKEVYQFAREVALAHGLGTVLDVGCGSGFKLMKYFKEFRTLGVDVAPTVAFLRKKYPERAWEICDFAKGPHFHADMVICADVIEHIPRPETLISYIKMAAPKLVVISTPERNLLMHGTHNGPPRNTAHVREWSYMEFRAYMDSEFHVLAHFISNPAQATQCVLARPKAGTVEETK